MVKSIGPDSRNLHRDKDRSKAKNLLGNDQKKRGDNIIADYVGLLPPFYVIQVAQVIWDCSVRNTSPGSFLVRTLLVFQHPFYLLFLYLVSHF